MDLTNKCDVVTMENMRLQRIMSSLQDEATRKDVIINDDSKEKKRLQRKIRSLDAKVSKYSSTIRESKKKANKLSTKLRSSIRIKKKMSPDKAILTAIKKLLPGKHCATHQNILHHSLKQLCQTSSQQHTSSQLSDAIKVMKSQSSLGNPVEYAKLIDTSGKFNLSAIDDLRVIEGLKKDERGLIPSKTSIQKVMRQLNEYGDLTLPSKLTANGDGWEFANFDVALDIILKLYKLDDVAKKSNVEIGFTLDGAVLTKNLTHVTAGIKIVDKRAIHPTTGLPIDRFQSRELCFPFKLVLAKDNAALYDNQFKQFFDFMNKCGQMGLPEYGYLPFNTSSPQDMCSHWKVLKIGKGIRSGKVLFCHCCNVTSEEVALSRDPVCDNCKHRGVTFCLHTQVGDAETVLAMKSKLADMVQQYGNIDKVIEHSHIHLGSSDAGYSSDPTCINYDPAEVEKLIDFSNLVDAELDLRQLATQTNLLSPLHVRRSILKERLIAEARIVYLKQHSSISYEDAMILINEAIPCVLHLRNRTGEKIFKEVVKESMSSINRNRSGNKHVIELKDRIDLVLNTSVWGSNDNPAQYSLPLVKSKKGTC